MAGGCSIRLRTSVAYSGPREATIYSNLVFCAVMPRVAHSGSACAHQTSGSDGQNGGSLRFIAVILFVSGLVRGSTTMLIGELVARRGQQLMGRSKTTTPGMNE